MFVIGKKESLKKAFSKEDKETFPVQLYGYGGFNISLTPGFSVSRLVFMNYLGGIVCVANLRFFFFFFFLIFFLFCFCFIFL